MKKIKNIVIGSVVMALPLVTTMSCSTTWTRWGVDDVEDTSYTYNPKTAPVILWQVRDIDEIKASAWNSSTNEINLDNVRNQYELMDLLTSILGLGSDVPIDQYWDDFDGMKTYLEGITKTLPFFKIKFGNASKPLIWNVETTIDNAIKGIDDYNLNPDPSAKAYDVELNGLNPDGQPNDFDQVATVGMSLTNIPVVSNLLAEDNAFAMAMSKLVNLPQQTFDSFKELLNSIDDLLTSILSSKQFNDWAAAKKLDFTVSASTGRTGVYAIDYAYERDDHFKGLFMLRALK